MRWDSGQEFIYRIGAEGAYDLRVRSAQHLNDILFAPIYCIIMTLSY